MKTNPLMDAIREQTSPEVRKQIDLQVMVANRVYDILEQKGLTQKELAQRLGKTETEVSRWLCGTHNMTLATIAKLAVALDDDLIVSTTSKKRHSPHLINSKLPTKVAML